MVHHSNEYIQRGGVDTKKRHPRGRGVICGKGILWFKHVDFSQDARHEFAFSAESTRSFGSQQLFADLDLGSGDLSSSGAHNRRDIAATTWKVVPLPEAEAAEHRSREEMMGSLSSIGSSMRSGLATTTSSSAGDINGDNGPSPLLSSTKTTGGGMPSEAAFSRLDEAEAMDGGGFGLGQGMQGGEELERGEDGPCPPVFRPIIRLALSENAEIWFNISRELPSQTLQMLEFYNLLVQISKNEEDIAMPHLGSGGIGSNPNPNHNPDPNPKFPMSLINWIGGDRATLWFCGRKQLSFGGQDGSGQVFEGSVVVAQDGG